MKLVTRESLGLKFQNSEYESPDEADQAAGRTGACLDECNDNLAYRGAFNDFRDRFLEALEKETEIKRKQEPTGEKEEDGTDVTQDEKPRIFVSRVLAETGKKIADFQYIADTITTSNDIRKAVRTGGPKVLPKLYKDRAELLIRNGSDKKWAEKLTQELGREVAPDVTSLGWAIKEREDNRRREAVAEYQ